MSNEEALKLGEVAMERDPREAPFGFYSGSATVMTDDIKVFSWFESIDELIAFLVDVEPRIYNIDEQNELAAHRAKVSPILEKLKTDGFNDALREEMNEAINKFGVIHWWGNFSKITAGKTEFSKNLIEQFVDVVDVIDVVDGRNLTIPADQMDEFIEYLKTCGC